MKPVAVIDLFCGMGGFSQGAIDGGATVIIAVDSWDAAIAEIPVAIAGARP